MVWETSTFLSLWAVQHCMKCSSVGKGKGKHRLVASASSIPAGRLLGILSVRQAHFQRKETMGWTWVYHGTVQSELGQGVTFGDTEHPEQPQSQPKK